MKRIFLSLTVLLGVISLSGCTTGSFGNGVSVSGGSVLKSFDSGATFIAKVKIDEKRSLSSADILTISFDPNDSSIVYVGTEADGILRTKDAGEYWEPINFPPKRVFGLIVDFRNSDRILASGIWEKVGKIYESEDGGKNWVEVYTEPGTGTLIASMTQSRANPDVVYAGTSGGVILRSKNGGKTWENFGVGRGPITEIYPNPSKVGSIVAAVFNVGVIATTNDGEKWTEILQDAFPLDKRAPSENGAQNGSSKVLLTLVSDPSEPDTFYAGTENSMYRTKDGGKTWSEVNIIESARKFPIRSIAINPKNSKEVSFVSGDTFYRSIDGGESWKPVRLNISRGVSVIAYDWNDPETLYLGLRKF